MPSPATAQIAETVPRSAPTLTNVLYEKKGAIAYMTVSRPKVLNALNGATWADLRTAFEDARDDGAVRGVILTGAGEKAFVAGADISELAKVSAVEAEASSRIGQGVLDLIENLGKPVVAAINGFALGGGCETAMACTLRIAVPHARFGQPEVKLGLLPGGGGTQRLPRLVGKGRALQLLLTGEMIGAEEAHRIGLVNEIVPAADLIARAEAILAQIAANGPVGVRYALEATNRGMDTSQSEGLALEAAYFGLCASTEDKKEGTLAFLENARRGFKVTEVAMSADPGFSEFYLTGADGLRIACSRWSNRAPLRGAVQIAHGMGEHIGRYQETIDALTSFGFIVFGNDHRGHGRTARSSGHVGDFGAGGFDLLVEDMVLLSQIARKENPGRPFFLLGHGMGSFAAQQYALDHSREIDGLILSGSGALDGLASVARSSSSVYGIVDDGDPGRTAFDWLSRDDAVVDDFLNDPLCFFELKHASLASFFAAAPRLADPRALQRMRRRLPVYVFSGSDDPVGQQLLGVQALIERFREAGIENLAHNFYAGGRHEMLNETNRAEVRARLVGWILATLKRNEDRRTRSVEQFRIPAFKEI